MGVKLFVGIIALANVAHLESVVQVVTHGVVGVIGLFGGCGCGCGCVGGENSSGGFVRGGCIWH